MVTGFSNQASQYSYYNSITRHDAVNPWNFEFRENLVVGIQKTRENFTPLAKIEVAPSSLCTSYLLFLS